MTAQRVMTGPRVMTAEDWSAAAASTAPRCRCPATPRRWRWRQPSADTGDGWSAHDLPRPAPVAGPARSDHVAAAAGPRPAPQPARRAGSGRPRRPATPTARRRTTAEPLPGRRRPAAPSLLASSRTMALASLVSRATGFLRTMAIAAAVGAGALQRRRRLRPRQHAAQHGLRAAARRRADQRHHPGAGQGPAGRRRPRAWPTPSGCCPRRRRAGRHHPARGAGRALADRHLRRAGAVPLGGRAVGHPAAAGDLLLRRSARCSRRS